MAVGSIWTFGACLALAIAAAMLKGSWQKAALAAGVLALGHATYTARVIERPRNSIHWALPAAATLMDVEGVIVTSPRVAAPQRGRFAPFAWYEQPVTRFELRVSRVFLDNGQSHAVSGRLGVRIGTPAPELRAGDRVRVVGMASLLEAPGNPGERDARPVAAQRGLVGRLTTDSMGTVSVLQHETVSGTAEAFWRRSLASVRARARAWIEAEDAADPSRALLVGLLLGERSDAMRDLNAAFSRVGLAHVLSVSGFHLVAFVMTLVLIIRIHGEHPRVEPLVVGVCVLGYLALMPAQAPIIRAGAMTLGLLATESFGRRYDRLNTLALVLAGIVLWRPMELWDIGCQLSFLSVAALVVFAQPLRVRLFGERPNRDELAVFGVFLEWLKDVLAASIAAWAFTAPLVAYHLGVVSPLAPLATLATLPLSILVVGLGYAGVVLGLLVPWAAGPAHWLIDTGASWLADMVLALDALPGGVIYLRGHGVSAALAIGAMIVLGWWMTHASFRRLADVVAAVVIIAWTCARLWPASLSDKVVMRLDSIDVGDGSCHLVRSGGEAVMYDCGSSWYAVGERVVPAAMRAIGAPRVETIIVSHPDIDHFAGVLDVVRPLGVRRVLIGEAFQHQAADHPESPAAYLLDELHRMGVAVEVIHAYHSLKAGSVSLRVLAPPPGFTSERDNDSSLVIASDVASSAGDRRLLLCGDIESAGIEGAQKVLGDAPVHILEAPHHGSARPQAIEWVRRLDPRVVVQSTGPSRAGDERWQGVRRGRQWLCTAVDGATHVEVRLDGTIEAGPTPR